MRSPEASAAHLAHLIGRVPHRRRPVWDSLSAPQTGWLSDAAGSGPHNGPHNGARLGRPANGRLDARAEPVQLNLDCPKLGRLSRKSPKPNQNRLLQPLPALKGSRRPPSGRSAGRRAHFNAPPHPLSSLLIACLCVASAAAAAAAPVAASIGAPRAPEAAETRQEAKLVPLEQPVGPIINRTPSVVGSNLIENKTWPETSSPVGGSGGSIREARGDQLESKPEMKPKTGHADGPLWPICNAPTRCLMFEALPGTPPGASQAQLSWTNSSQQLLAFLRESDLQNELVSLLQAGSGANSNQAKRSNLASESGAAEAQPEPDEEEADDELESREKDRKRAEDGAASQRRPLSPSTGANSNSKISKSIGNYLLQLPSGLAGQQQGQMRQQIFQHINQFHLNQQQLNPKQLLKPASLADRTAQVRLAGQPARDTQELPDELEGLMDSSFRLLPLQEYSLAPTSLATGNQSHLVLQVRQLMERLAAGKEPQERVQALSLRQNQISAELWPELYALLAVYFRHQLIQLDLSRNTIQRLGPTFTGRIEHRLALAGWPAVKPGARSSSSMQPVSSPRNPPGGLHAKLLGVGWQPPGETSLPRWPQTLPLAGSNVTRMRQLLGQTIQVALWAHQLRALDLSHNRLRWLVNDQFRALKLLQSLRLDHNRLRYMHQHAFQGLDSLRYLNLNGNKLQVIYVEQFSTNHKLLSLLMRANHLAYLRAGSFGTLARLARLDLSQNKLSLVSSNAFLGLESLQLLNCSSNQLVKAPSGALHSLVSLRQLDLSDNSIGQLEPGAFSHLVLEQLWLDRNEPLMSIQRAAFWDLPCLLHLSLNGCSSLTSLHPQAFIGLSKLDSVLWEKCPALDAPARQLLQRLAPNSSRSGPPEVAESSEPKLSQAATNATDRPGNWSRPETEATPVTLIASKSIPATNDSQQALRRLAPIRLAQGQADRSARYIFYLVSAALLALALKLVLGYTGGPEAGTLWLANRRRRRQVYQVRQVDRLELVESNAFVIGGSLARPFPCTANTPQASPDSGSSFDSGANSNSGSDSDSGEPEVDEISVISEALLQLQACAQSSCWGPQNEAAASCCALSHCHPFEAGHSRPEPNEPLMINEARQADEQVNPMELIHRQLVAAGFDYGHANCAHFYHSLAPAIQIADLSAELTNQMDYY